MGIEIPTFELDEWLKELKPYQQNVIRVFLADTTPEKAAEKWIAATGSPNIVPFGGVQDPKPFWDKFKAEFRRYICDDDAYVDEKKELLAKVTPSKELLISCISAAIGATIGYSATLVAPAVAVLLYTIGKMGINAYCRNDQ